MIESWSKVLGKDCCKYRNQQTFSYAKLRSHIDILLRRAPKGGCDSVILLRTGFCWQPLSCISPWKLVAEMRGWYNVIITTGLFQTFWWTTRKGHPLSCHPQTSLLASDSADVVGKLHTMVDAVRIHDRLSSMQEDRALTCSTHFLQQISTYPVRQWSSTSRCMTCCTAQ